MPSSIHSKTCPQCRSRLYEQVVNGSETLFCGRCKYKAATSPTNRTWSPPVRRIARPSTAVATGRTARRQRPQAPRRPAGPPGAASGSGRGAASSPPAAADPPAAHPPPPRTAAEYAGEVRGRKDCELVYESVLPAEVPSYADESIPELISSKILQKAVGESISHLYRFQAEAISKIRAGKNVVVTASTASGKTMAFLIPVIDRILEGRRAQRGGVSALFLYPTKALASDQIANIAEIAESCGISAKQLDGSKKEPGYRDALLSKPPEILATNFDFVSYHLARSEHSDLSARFCKAIASLRFIVVDEAHQYTGFFGANVSWIIRRLARLNAGVQLVASSATMDDPVRFCSRLFSAEAEEVRGSGSRGPMTLQMIRTSSERRVMTDLTRMFALDERQTLAFARSRREAEMIGIDGSDKRLEIHVHRSGMTDERRGIIESGLRSGGVRAVACTPTLEVGINLGRLDAVVSSYTPHQRLLQRIGRAGRSGQESNAVLVLDEDSAIPGYYASHPDQYLVDGRSHAHGLENPTVDEKQLLLMASDRPIAAGEVPDGHEGTVAALAHDGLLEAGEDGAYRCTERGWDAVRSYSIRDIGTSVTLYASSGGSRGARIGQVEAPLAYFWLHPGALYFHDRRTYRSVSVRQGEYPSATLRQVSTKNVTTPIVYRSARMERVVDSRSDRPIGASAYGRVRVYHTISGYYERSRYASMDKATMHEARTNLKFDYATAGTAFRIVDPGPATAGAAEAAAQAPPAGPGGPSPGRKRRRRRGRGAARPLPAELSVSDMVTEADTALHAVKHLLAHAATMITGADHGDISGIVDHDQGIVMFYDNSMNGGNGFSKAVYDRQDEIVRRAASLVGQCPCKEPEGCPRCTKWEGCSHFNRNLDKKGAARLLRSRRAR